MADAADDDRLSAELIPLRPRGSASPGTAPPQNAPHGGPPAREKPFVSFDRHELSEILKVYGRMVAAGEWRDYAIDTLADRAVFSIFRRSTEVPLYRVEKNPKLARRQGAYAVISQTGVILKRGTDLSRVIRVIDKSVSLVDA